MLAKWNNLRLLTKLMIMIVTTLAIAIGCLYLISRQVQRDAIIETESNYLLNIGSAIADEDLIVDALVENKPSKTLSTFTHSYEEKFDLDYIVVINRDSIRLSHPDSSLINKPFAGGDEAAAFTGEAYVSNGVGTLGVSLRSFVPVYKENQEIIGAVVVGKTNHTLDIFNEKYARQMTTGLILSLAIGIIVAIFVAYTIKKELFNMEPKEIAQAFEERSAMLNYSHDAIIVTNHHHQITLANKEAVRHFNIQVDDDGPFIQDIIPSLKLTATHNAVFTYREKEYLLSQADILVQNQLLGQIYIIRDTSEIYTLLDQLHSTTEYAQLLQVQAHEFLNRLHVIYGLSDLKEYNALDQYLASLIKEEEDLTIRLSMLVKNPVIAGHLIGASRALKQSLNDVVINIRTEIPNHSSAETNQLWIHTVETVNKLMLEEYPDTRLWLDLDFDDCALTTYYRIQGTIDGLSEKLSTEDWLVDYQLDHLENALSFSFKIDYIQGEVS